MGLTRSIKRRAALIEGEDFATAVKVLFANRQARRAFELQKFGCDLNHVMNQEASMTRKAALPSVTDAMDREWYADVNGLESPKNAPAHYLSYGVNHALAPFPELAADDGKSLSIWGIEYLVRMGFPVGEAGSSAMAADDPAALDPFQIINHGKKRIAVVTAIFGEFDSLIPVDQSWQDGADFYLVSDRRYEVESGWRQVRAPFHHEDPRRKARFVKLNLPTFFSDYEWVIWIDGNVMMCQNPESILASLGSDDFDFATFSHPDRKGLIAEAAKCVQLGKDDMRTMAAHLDANQTHSAFRGSGLFETMVMVMRPNADSVRKMCSIWWRMLSRGSKRDQMSLPLAVADTPDLRLKPLPDTIELTPYFARTRHRA